MEQTLMKKLLILLACLSLCLPTATAEEWRTIPDVLRFSYTLGDREPLGYLTYLRRCYPQTALPHVNKEIAFLVDHLAGRDTLLPGKCQEQGYLDVTCRISRSGDSVMSFLVLGSKVEDRVQTGVAFENRVYDMQTGRPVSLSALFPEESDAWALLAREVKAQLAAYYPQLEADAEALDALCERESLQNAAFSLTPVQLEMHYLADTLYPGKCTVMHVRIPYRTLRPYMTEYALRQTDNTGYQLAALTYDDGPVRNTSHRVMDALLSHGANATFFIVGSRMLGHKDILCREQDAGFSVASHNWEHTYNERDDDRIRAWKTRFDTTMSNICGATPRLMRAPGGNYDQFQRAKAGLPLIQWSLISGDAEGDHSSAKLAQIAGNVRSGTDAGDIVLMHDMNPHSPQYTQEILDRLEERNILCVTVEELMIHYGAEPEADKVYFSFNGMPVPPITEGSNAQ